MKFTLVFLCALVVISHQQFQRPRGVNWFAPYFLAPQPVFNNQQRNYHNYLDDESLLFHNLRIASSQNEELYKEQLDNRKEGNADDGTGLHPDEYQSRIRGSLAQQQQQNARFFFSLIPFFAANTAGTVTSIVITTSVISCVPSFQVAEAPVPVCRRKRNEFDYSDNSQQFPIAPSETLKLVPTTLPTLHSMLEKRQLPVTDDTINRFLLSSKNKGEMTINEDQMNLRGKRLFFNSNTMASPITSFVFVPKLITVTVNLLNPAPSAQCLVADSATDATPQCVACLPAGLIVCPAR